MPIRFRRFPGLAALLGGLACGPGDLVTPPPPGPPPALRLVEVARTLSFPLLVTAPPEDLTRIFIVEKGGRIRIVRNGALLPQPFLDLSSRVSTQGEQGLLGLAFHPNYTSNGRFVVHYTDPAGDSRIAAFRVSGNPDVADPASEQVILAIDQPFQNHNGGMLQFGPDGRLYIAMGDGGSGGDPLGNGQNRNTLLGKILRLALSDAGQPSIPPDNPFVGQPGRRGEIWSYGLRNPWRFAFDRATGDLYIADVGQSDREEVNVATQASQFGRGLNFGWNIMEGTFCFNAVSCDQSGLTLPVLDYPHTEGCSITGGYVYRGTAIPGLAGTYFYADFCQGWVRSFRLVNGVPTDRQDWVELRPGGQIPSFGEDGRGELYLMTAGGVVYRIAPAEP